MPDPALHPNRHRSVAAGALSAEHLHCQIFTATRRSNRIGTLEMSLFKPTQSGWPILSRSLRKGGVSRKARLYSSTHHPTSRAHTPPSPSESQTESPAPPPYPHSQQSPVPPA